MTVAGRQANHDSTDAWIASALLSVDPSGLGGIWTSGRMSRALAGWLKHTEALLAALGPVKRVPLSISDDRLLGGLDIAATLAAGQPIAQRGLLAEADGGALILPNAEVTRRSVINALSGALDTGRLVCERDGFTQINPARFCVLAIAEDDAPAASSLRERLAFHVQAETLDPIAASPSDDLIDTINAARSRLAHVSASDTATDGLCSASVVLGVHSARAVIFALRAARASAALDDRSTVDDDDLALAARLVLAPRATQYPAEQNDAETDPPPPPDDPRQHEQDAGPQDRQALEDMIIAAATAVLPENVLKLLSGQKQTAKKASADGRSGARQKSKHHGACGRSRRGDPRDGAPLDILETLRAAAPWQTLRRNELSRAGITRPGEGQPRVEVRRDDFRLRTFKNHRETATIFVVDASGSSALHRLAEAKGAIELLLADCYARRDSVALIGFRGTTADVLLPPTRSLTRVKRSLAALPGGGGTPLAIATDCAASLAVQALRKGQTPTLVFLTDGKANIDRKVAASRQNAQQDAIAAARAIMALGCSSLVIDTSPRPGDQSRSFAAAMGALYLPLPHADAAVLSGAVRTANLSAGKAG
jgi:magnesium chelatase subunit D